MENNVNLKFEGLKCDNEKCGYNDDSIKRSEYENCINKACPNCGQNLLTFNDYMNVLILENAVNEANKIQINDKKEKISVKVNLHKGISFDI